MDYYLDTEFSERPCTIDLISIALIREDGAAIYAESSEINEDLCNNWVKANVLPKRVLSRKDRTSRSAIKDQVLTFIGDDKPRFWGYFADYDWVVFCWLFGSMIDLPKGWPMYCNDLKQEMARLKIPKEMLPKQPGDEHNALADAIWIREAHHALRRVVGYDKMHEGTL